MTQPNIFQEVQEDIQRQRMEELWRRYGPYLLGAALLIIFATAGITYYRSWQTERNQAVTDGLMAILNVADASKAEETKALDDFIKKNPGTSQATMAQLYAAAAVIKDDNAKAVALYDAVASDPKADPAFRQYADLMAVEAQVDSADAGAIRARLKPLTAEGAPWRYSALDLEGHLALKSGDKAGARQAFSTLAHDGGTPAQLSENAAEMLRFIGE